MRKWVFLLAVGLASLANTGCFINVWDPNPNVRALQLLQMSEDLRQARIAAGKVMFQDTPTTLNPSTPSGIVGPGGGG